MPSEVKYVFTAVARRSPSARLYSAVPRSSQCPSTVTTQVGYFRRNVGVGRAPRRDQRHRGRRCRARRRRASTASHDSESSSDRLPTESSDNGCGGTGSASSTRCGGRGRGSGHRGRLTCRRCGGGAAWGVAGLATTAARRDERRHQHQHNTDLPRSAHDSPHADCPHPSVRPCGHLVVPGTSDLPHLLGHRGRS